MLSLSAPVSTEPAWLAVAFVLGALIGSFLNVVVHRLPRMLERRWRDECAQLAGTPTEDGATYNLARPRSACPECGHVIRWFENIPILSYVAQRGRCNHCGTVISARYPLVEGLTAVLTAYTVWHFGPTPASIAALLLAWGLVALTFIDYDTQLLPDDITFPLLWGGLLWNLDGGFVSLHDAVLGATAGYLILWTVYHVFRLLTGKEGMGYGDFKLLGALGAWLGWTMLPLIILASSVMGAIIGLSMIALAGHDRARPIPFGPYLALGGLIALYWGEPLVRAYLGA